MTRFFRAATLPVAALFLFVCAAPPGDDLVFTGGRVVDGTGKGAFRGDVAVKDGRIAAVGDLAPDRIARARRRIDATGLVVAPGFIDLLGQSEYNALVDRRAASKITQGITSEVTGEGESIAPLDETLLKSNEDTYRHYGLRPDWSSLLTYFMRFRRTPPSINLGTFVGLGGLRRVVIGTEDRRAFAAARASGLDVAANQYPWNAGSNGLDACLPPWVREGGRERLLARLRDPE